MEEKLQIIKGEYNDWIPINKISPNAKFVSDIQVINCDTRDFCIGWQYEKPTILKKATCGWEFRYNKSLRKLYSVLRKHNRDKWAIRENEIIPWLDSLCKATGGYDLDWRFLAADVDGCRNWDIKYLRFVRNGKMPNEFVVCNAYNQPIEYREILGKIIKE